MNKTQDVLVSIRGLQIDAVNSDDSIEVVTNGKFSKKNNKRYLRFEEVLDNDGITKNLLTFDEKSLELKRKGAMQLYMGFYENQQTMTSYGTPFGNILVGVDTKKIQLFEDDRRVRLSVDYALALNHEHIADCALTVDIEPQG
ncbi:MAG: DUF1934 domain-containing protein [Lachnospiraceae bacterium]|nr:DUF1934 domain-containing protein [Lachnospiraceae bacterium]